MNVNVKKNLNGHGRCGSYGPVKNHVITLSTVVQSKGPLSINSIHCITLIFFFQVLEFQILLIYEVSKHNGSCNGVIEHACMRLPSLAS